MTESLFLLHKAKKEEIRRVFAEKNLIVKAQKMIITELRKEEYLDCSGRVLYPEIKFPVQCTVDYVTDGTVTRAANGFMAKNPTFVIRFIKKSSEPTGERLTIDIRATPKADPAEMLRQALAHPWSAILLKEFQQIKEGEE